MTEFRSPWENVLSASWGDTYWKLLTYRRPWIWLAIWLRSSALCPVSSGMYALTVTSLRTPTV